MPNSNENQVDKSAPKFYRAPEIKKAVNAAEALQHLLKRDLLTELEKTGKAPAAIDALRSDLKDVDFSKMGEKHNFFYRILCQGASFALKTVGLQTFGQKIGEMGYKTDTASYVKSIVQGTRTAMENISAEPGSNSGQPVWKDAAVDWLKNRAELSGLGKNEVESLFNTKVSKAR